MGTKNTKIDSIIYYYTFQKEINNYLNISEKRKEKTNLKNGYIINPEWIKEWKKRINYDKIVSEYLVYFNINSTKINNNQELMIHQFIENDYPIDNLCYETKNIQKYNDFMIIDKLITKNLLENLVNVKTFEKLGIRDESLFDKVKYIFKEKMFILFIEKHQVIKILLLTLNYKNEIFNLINFTLIYDKINYFKDNSVFFEQSKSDKIINFFKEMNIFENESLVIKFKNYPIFIIKNENYIEILKKITNKQTAQNQEEQDAEKSLINKEKNIIDNSEYFNQIDFKFDNVQKEYNIGNNINNNFYQNMFNLNNTFQNNNFQDNSFFQNNNINNSNNNIEQNIDTNKCQNNLIYNKEYELNKKINELENLLMKEKKENNQLILKINDLENKLKLKISNENSLNKLIEELEKTKIDLNENLLQLKKILKTKDNEIIKLKEKLNQNNLILNIISFDESINVSLLVKKTDSLTNIEEEIYNKYPEYRNINNYFKINNQKINKYKSLEENNIKEGSIITLCFPDKIK